MTTYYGKGKVTLDTMVEVEERALWQAREEGMTVVPGDAKTLMIDLDDKRHHPQFANAWKFLTERVAVESLAAWRSKSGNIHVKVTLMEALTPQETVMWQTVLGSDPARERWNTAKVICGQKVFQYLFRPEGSAYEYDGVPVMLYCRGCAKLSVLTRKQYNAELGKPDSTWSCTNCRSRGCEVIEA